MAGNDHARTVSWGERSAGIALLALLAACFVALLSRGSHYRLDALLRAPPATSGESPSAPLPPGDWLQTLLPPAFEAIGWARDGGVETYPEDRLFQRIDGADERYKLFGNVRLICASYASRRDVRAGVEVAVFEMRTPLAALGIFGRELPPNVTIGADLGDASYAVEGGVFFRKGAWYVQVKGFGAEAAAASEHLARHVAAKLSAAEAPELAFAFLPVEGRIRGTERYDPRDAALGTDFLEHVCSADYGSPEKPARLFAVCGAGKTEAVRAAYADFLKRQGKVLEENVLEGASVTLMDLDGSYDGFFTEGDVLAGVQSASDQTALRKYLGTLVRSVRASPPPPRGSATR